MVINVVAFTSNSTDPDVLNPDVTFYYNSTRKCALSLCDYKRISRTLFLFAPVVIHIMQSAMSTTNTVDKGVWSACWLQCIDIVGDETIGQEITNRLLPHP